MEATRSCCRQLLHGLVSQQHIALRINDLARWHGSRASAGRRPIPTNPKACTTEFLMQQNIRFGCLAAALFFAVPLVHAAPYTLSTGSGDGSVTLGVDGYGSFGGSVGSDATDAVYNPIGSLGAAGTSYESAVAIRFGTTGSRQFLTSGDIGGSSGLTNPLVTGSGTAGSSSFTFGGLSFSLQQTLATLTSGSTQTGSLLTQTYTITNTGSAASVFEMVRYFDGDLDFDGSLIDGGGRIILDGLEVLFETDTAAGTSTETTFVGITGEGGTNATGRYQVSGYSGLRGSVLAGTALNNLIQGDSADADQFVDAGDGYDITLALVNQFNLAAGGTATYTTRTIFGSGAPEDIVVTPPPAGTVPEPGTLALLLAGAGALALRRKR
nr:PEP-CTERM sorting domain-containing protein [Schlegelella koreensis]